MLSAQNVTTWHNDNYRTGWQQNETALTASSVNQAGFGLLWQWPVTGAVFAQPLAVANVQNVQNCPSPCNLVFISTEQNWLYAFNAASSSPTPVWSKMVATAVNCNGLQIDFEPCDSGYLGTYVGMTGTPVIDTSSNILYVVGATENSPSSIGYSLFAVDITSGTVLASINISGSVNGKSPGAQAQCTSTYPAQGQVTFDYNHIQRSALLLLNGIVYVAFAPSDGEVENGWIFGYQYGSGALNPMRIFNSTPYGTGGGIWASGAGPASDGTSIFVTTGNGTTFDYTTTPPTIIDVGDSLLKLDPTSPTLNILDYYTPDDVFKGSGRCANDLDFGSGGVLVVPDVFYNGLNLVINADKESNVYVADRTNLGKYNPSGGNNVQVIQTPTPPAKKGQVQGYWGSPAYWKYTSGSATNYMLYYAATDKTPTVAPLPINGYQLLTTGSSGPISTAGPTVNTATLFCNYSPTPSVSSYGTSAGTGVVWGIEHQNKGNPTNCPKSGDIGIAALHAFNATTLVELYSSRSVQTTIGPPASFQTPTVFKGQVYMGTKTEVDVFGPCSTTGPGQICLP
jgi:hypothetical protein